MYVTSNLPCDVSDSLNLSDLRAFAEALQKEMQEGVASDQGGVASDQGGVASSTTASEDPEKPQKEEGEGEVERESKNQ